MLEAILFGALVAVVVMLLTWEVQERRLNLPPGPKGIPVFGNLFQLMRATMKGEAPFVTFAKWAFQYGKEGISYMKFGTTRVVVISDTKLAQQMCVRMADHFSSRPTGLFVARVLKGKGIVCNNGPSWKAHRTFIQQEFRKFGFARQSIELPIQQVADELVKQFQKFEGIPHNPHAEFATASYNIIWNVISGVKFDWDDPFLFNLIHNLETNLEAMELVGAHNYILVLTLIQLIRHNPPKLLALFMERLAYFRKLIADHKANMEKDEDSMIHDYLEYIKKPPSDQELSEQLTEPQLLFLVSDLFIAGGETTITTLRWATLCLAVYTDVQDRIRQEMMDNLGPNATPSYTHRAQLPYLEAFVHEVLRFCGVTPGMWRNTDGDCKVAGYDIPNNTWVLLHFWAMSNQENTWKDAKLFKPERFLDHEGKFQKDENLAAFSTGRRQCPGESLAKTEIFTLLTSVLQKFRITLADEHDWKTLPEGTFGVTYTPPPFRVVFHRIEGH